MGNLKKHSIFLLFLIVTTVGFAQKADSLSLSLSEAEDRLLQNNLSLLAEQLNITKADAQKIQAKVWPNPRISIENFNPFTTAYQRKHAEEQASLFGSKQFGKYRQIEIQLEQTFNLAGKRQKRQAIADVSREQAEAYLANFLLDLKTEFRKTIYDYTFHQEYLKMLKRQTKSISKLVMAYQKQYDQGNVDKMQLTRLKVSKMDLSNEIIDQKNQRSDLQTKLIVLLNLSEDTNLSFKAVFNETFQADQPNLGLDYLQEKALEKRPDMAISMTTKRLAEKKYKYEKSLRTPDLDIAVNYDRGGGIYPDFVGVGVAIDLPFSNPNKGNIKKAKIEIEQQDFYLREKIIEVKTEVRRRFEKLLKFRTFLTSITREEIKDLDKTMNVYTKSFKTQSIDITTYMDFLEAYMTNKEHIYNKQRDYLNALEDLRYATGLELE